MAARTAIIVMGVAGSGKSVAGIALAERLGAIFVEGDKLHPPENVARMASGLPLADAHRAGWLDRIGETASQTLAGGRDVVVACSALKRIYRDRLRGFVPGFFFVCLDIDKATAFERVGSRKEHFMPASLVESQFEALELPMPDEAALIIDGTLPPDTIIDAALAAIRAR